MATILIVEDNQHMHRIYAGKFRLDGFRVLDAFDGPEGLAIAVQEKPHAILLDLMMPKMDGYSVLQKLKENPATTAIPVLVISNKSQPVDIERALMMGAQKFLYKGITSLDDIALEFRRLCQLKKALLVSNRPAVAEAVARPLEALGFLCSVNSMVIETQSRVEREHPDLLLLDAQHPGLSIHLLLQRLQASEKAQSIPVIVLGDLLSGSVTGRYAQVAAQLAVPFEPSALEEAVKRCTSSPLQRDRG